MTSNGLYAAAVDEALNETSPSAGQDYSFLPEKFPVTWDLPDISDQVSAFLSMEKPEQAPGETLWVFSFGTWDIWSLASMPRVTSTHAIDVMVEHIFREMERLYLHSLDEDSIAWSDSSLPMPSEGAESGSTRHSTLPAGFNVTAVTDGIETGSKETGSKETGSKETARTKHFRVLVPKLFDPTLTPGWHSARPEVPSVHSKAEQLRNAVLLTDLWNAYLHSRLREWVDTPGPEVEAEDDAEDEDPEAEEPLQLPQRDAISYDLPAYLMEMIIEGQLRSAGVNDSKGMGSSMPTNQTFREVRLPCVSDASAPDDAEDAVYTGGEITDAEEATYTGGETTNAEETPEATPTTTTVTSSEAPQSPPSTRHRRVETAQDDDDDDEDGTADAEPTAALQVCSSPRDHLFFTAFALSQRAIADVAGEAAGMVRRNETERARRAAAARAEAEARS